MTTDTDWKQRAACRTVPTAVFFPPLFDDDSPGGDPDIAKAVCKSCTVYDECSFDQRYEVYGVRFETTPHERGVRGKQGPSRTGLRDAVIALLRDDPQREWTIAEAARRLRHWPDTSVRSALGKLVKDGHVESHLSGKASKTPRSVLYSWKVTND